MGINRVKVSCSNFKKVNGDLPCFIFFLFYLFIYYVFCNNDKKNKWIKFLVVTTRKTSGIYRVKVSCINCKKVNGVLPC